MPLLAAQYTTDLRPPNRRLLRWLDRLWLPFASAATILGVTLPVALSETRGEVVLWWSPAAFVFLLLITGAHMSAARHPAFHGLLGPQAMPRVGVIAWSWLTVLVVTVSETIHLVSLLAIWPAYVLPFVLFIVRPVRSDRTTTYVIVLTVATALTLFFAMRRAVTWTMALPQPSLTWTLALAAIGAVSVWAIVGLLLVYYAVRRAQLDRIRAEVVQQVMLEMAQLDDPFSSAESVATLLQSRANVGKRVFILHLDPATDSLRVVAWAGEQAERAARYELPAGRGISRQAIAQRRTIIVDDVRGNPHFVSGGLPERGSEMAVPILVAESNAHYVLGTITVQDHHTRAFTPDDARTVERLANLIGAFGRRYSGHFSERLDSSLRLFYTLREPDDLIGAAVDAARALFDDPLVCYIRLAVGTAVPLSPPFLSGEVRDPAFFHTLAAAQPGSDLLCWIEGWRPIFVSELSEPKAGGALSRHAATKERARSLCILPLGSRRAQVGLLLMIFRAPRTFSRAECFDLLAFAREITPYIERAEYRSVIHQGFARPQAHFHSTMAVAGLGRGTWETIFQEILDHPCLADERLRERIAGLRLGIKLFLDRIRASEATQLTQFHRLGRIALREALREACADLQERLPGLVIREIDEQIEVESNDVKLILFVLVMEAVRNALIHGRGTSRVHVQVQRLPDEIVVTVADDGCGFDPAQVDAAQQPEPALHSGADGIFQLGQMLQRFLGTPPLDWEGTAPGRGTRLRCRIPILATHDDRDP